MLGIVVAHILDIVVEEDRVDDIVHKSWAVVLEQDNQLEGIRGAHQAAVHLELEDNRRELEVHTAEALEELHKPVASGDKVVVLLGLHTERQVDWAEEDNVPVQVQSKDPSVADRAVDDLLAVLHKLVAAVVEELQVECC